MTKPVSPPVTVMGPEKLMFCELEIVKTWMLGDPVIVTGVLAKKLRLLRFRMPRMGPVQLLTIVKVVWSGELETASSMDVNAPGVAPVQSMVALLVV